MFDLPAVMFDPPYRPGQGMATGAGRFRARYLLTARHDGTKQD
jgi:hypothetical protein